jgi:hypothetical protein
MNEMGMASLLAAQHPSMQPEDQDRTRSRQGSVDHPKDRIGGSSGCESVKR